MKATGIVRRIDDLGRVVIPKEIRKTLRIKEGTPLEIFTDREGGDYSEKVFPYRRTECFCKGICRGAGAVKRDGSVYHRSRSGWWLLRDREAGNMWENLSAKLWKMQLRREALCLPTEMTEAGYL